MRTKECAQCGADISDSYQPAESDVGIYGGWYCDACDLAVGDEDGLEPHDDDVGLLGTIAPIVSFSGLCPYCQSPLESGYGLAGGGGIGPYMYCPAPHCGRTFEKIKDRT